MILPVVRSESLVKNRITDVIITTKIKLASAKPRIRIRRLLKFDFLELVFLGLDCLELEFLGLDCFCMNAPFVKLYHRLNV